MGFGGLSIQVLSGPDNIYMYVSLKANTESVWEFYKFARTLNEK